MHVNFDFLYTENKIWWFKWFVISKKQQGGFSGIPIFWKPFIINAFSFISSVFHYHKCTSYFWMPYYVVTNAALNLAEKMLYSHLNSIELHLPSSQHPFWETLIPHSCEISIKRSRSSPFVTEVPFVTQNQILIAAIRRTLSVELRNCNIK